MHIYRVKSKQADKTGEQILLGQSYRKPGAKRSTVKKCTLRNPMKNSPKTELAAIRTILIGERLAVLSTQKAGQPYASLVAFAFTDDLKQLLFLTPSTTRKYENLTASPRVAMLINNSRNRVEDIVDAVSITAVGTAVTVKNDAKSSLLELYLLRHPHLKSFAAAPTTALVAVLVDRYIMVNRFQNVVEIVVGS